MGRFPKGVLLIFLGELLWFTQICEASSNQVVGSFHYIEDGPSIFWSEQKRIGFRVITLQGHVTADSEAIFLHVELICSLDK